MQGNTFPACAAPFHVSWKITWTSEGTLGQSDFYPFACQGWSRLWLALLGFVVWRLKGKKGRASIDAHHDAFTAHLVFLCFALCHKLHMWLQAKNLVVLDAAQDNTRKSMRALLAIIPANYISCPGVVNLTGGQIILCSKSQPAFSSLFFSFFSFF